MGRRTEGSYLLWSGLSSGFTTTFSANHRKDTLLCCNLKMACKLLGAALGHPLWCLSMNWLGKDRHRSARTVTSAAASACGCQNARAARPRAARLGTVPACVCHIDKGAKQAQKPTQKQVGIMARNVALVDRTSARIGADLGPCMVMAFTSQVTTSEILMAWPN